MAGPTGGATAENANGASLASSLAAKTRTSMARGLGLGCNIALDLGFGAAGSG